MNIESNDYIVPINRDLIIFNWFDNLVQLKKRYGNFENYLNAHIGKPFTYLPEIIDC